jgi:hypothetical protein
MRSARSGTWAGHPASKTANYKAAETYDFDVLVTADQNIRYQQNLQGRKLALVVLGSNIWPVVRTHEVSIMQAVDPATPGSYVFIEMPLPPKPPRTGPPSF